MASVIASNRKNRVLAWFLSMLGYHVTVVSVESGHVPYLEVSAYGCPNCDDMPLSES